MTNPWKYVKVDPEAIKNNPYLRPDAEEPAPATNPQPVPIPSTVANAGGFLKLENIVCVGADGKKLEEHPTIYVAKDVERKQDGSFVSFTPYQAITHFERNGLFLPSYALSCNILAALYAGRSDPEVKKVLDQYKDYGPGYGWHAQNTVVDGKGCKIIHYPNDADFTSHGGNDAVNAKRRIEKQFKKGKNWDNLSLEDALKDNTKVKFIRDLTGLPNPSILVEIGQYFGKTAWFYPPGDSVRSAWLGCDYNYLFNIYTYDYLNNVIAARGVRR